MQKKKSRLLVLTTPWWSGGWCCCCVRFNSFTQRNRFQLLLPGGVFVFTAFKVYASPKTSDNRVVPFIKKPLQFFLLLSPLQASVSLASPTGRCRTASSSTLTRTNRISWWPACPIRRLCRWNRFTCEPTSWDCFSCTVGSLYCCALCERLQVLVAVWCTSFTAFK